MKSVNICPSAKLRLNPGALKLFASEWRLRWVGLKRVGLLAVSLFWLGGCSAMQGVNVGASVPIGGLVNVGANTTIGDGKKTTPQPKQEEGEKEDEETSESN